MNKNVTIGTNQYIIMALAAATAIIHLALGLSTNFPLFILNAIGYLGLAGALYYGPRFVPQLAGMRNQIRWVLIGYTALTIILYFVMNGATSFSNAIGLITKVIEAVLIVLLYRE